MRGIASPHPHDLDVTGLGVLPLAIGAGDAGREIEGPMAIVILGGLLDGLNLSCCRSWRCGLGGSNLQSMNFPVIPSVSYTTEATAFDCRRESATESELDAAARDEFARNSAARGAAPGENRKPDAYGHAGALRAECRGLPRDG